MTDVTMETFAQLEAYKTEERIARREMANALNLRLSAIERQQKMAAMAAEYPAVAEFYASQMSVNPAGEAALSALVANVLEDLAIMQAMQAADESIFFGKVPMPVETEEPIESEEGEIVE
jgi:hypothetical protein